MRQTKTTIKLRFQNVDGEEDHLFKKNWGLINYLQYYLPLNPQNILDLALEISHKGCFV